jgi:hypothetical protein
MRTLTGHVALPVPSQTPHVTLSGGSLSGLDVVRAEDTEMSTPDKVEVGAKVQLVDGRVGEVVEVSGRRLSRYGVIAGDAKIRLESGETVPATSRSIASVLERP